MEQKDIKHLEWIHEKLWYIHGEHKGNWYMLRLQSIIDELHKGQGVTQQNPRKRYTLKIPANIPKVYIRQLETLLDYDNTIIEYIKFSKYKMHDGTYYNKPIMSDWLVEVDKYASIDKSIDDSMIICECLNKLESIVNHDFHGYRSEVWNIIATAIKQAKKNTND